jgi:hypothetical protein
MPCYSFHQAADMTNGWPEGIVLAGTTLGKMAFNATVRRPDTLRCNASRSGNRRSGRDCSSARPSTAKRVTTIEQKWCNAKSAVFGRRHQCPDFPSPLRGTPSRSSRCNRHGRRCSGGVGRFSKGRHTPYCRRGPATLGTWHDDPR